MKKIQNNNTMSFGHSIVNLKSRFEYALKSYLTGWSFTKFASESADSRLGRITKKN